MRISMHNARMWLHSNQVVSYKVEDRSIPIELCWIDSGFSILFYGGESSML